MSHDGGAIVRRIHNYRLGRTINKITMENLDYKPMNTMKKLIINRFWQMATPGRFRKFHLYKKCQMTDII